MPLCCRRNGSGRCTGCVCARAKRQCSTCLPIRRGHCCNPENLALSTTTSISQVPEEIVTAASHSEREPNPDSSNVPIDTQQPLQNENNNSLHPSRSDDTIGDTTHEQVTPQLPPFGQVCHNLDSLWGTCTIQEFSDAIDDAYGQIVHWRPNLFMVPSGNSGKQFIENLTKLFTAYAQESSHESFAIKAAMTMPALLLQKPHSKSKTKDHITCLARRLST